MSAAADDAKTEVDAAAAPNSSADAGAGGRAADDAGTPTANDWKDVYGVPKYVSSVVSSSGDPSPAVEIVEDPDAQLLVDGFWVFGYGSLVWKPELPYDIMRTGRIQGWIRRFWQGSPDHRGTPEQPGRVVTVLHTGVASDSVLGVVFHIPAAVAADTLESLHYREKAGYSKDFVSVSCDDGTTVQALVFAAVAGNDHFLGEAPIEIIAKQIATCAGPSGPNRQYFDRLLHFCRAHGESDPHLDAIQACLDG